MFLEKSVTLEIRSRRCPVEKLGKKTITRHKKQKKKTDTISSVGSPRSESKITKTGFFFKKRSPIEYLQNRSGPTGSRSMSERPCPIIGRRTAFLLNGFFFLMKLFLILLLTNAAGWFR